MQLAEAFERFAVERHDPVADLEPGVTRRRPLAEPGDGQLFGRIDRHGAADDHEEGSENRHCHDNVGDRACRYDHGTPPQGSVLERPLFGRCGGGGDAGGVHVALELDVASQRQCRDTPARSVPVVEPDQLLAETDREGIRLHAERAAHEQVAEFVQCDQRPQHQQEP